jgi:acetyl-CoA carboxylase / biotin carboxylase 1
MKMYMPLIAAEDGIAQFVKQPSASLAPGDILGIWTLDDPAHVKHVKPFEGLLPATGTPAVISSKPHQCFHSFVKVLNNVLDSFDNSAIMAIMLKDLMAILEDLTLLFSEATAILSTLSGCMPMKLEDGICSVMDTAQSKAVVEFPAACICKLLDAHLAENVHPQDHTLFCTQLGALFDVVEFY